MGDRLATTGAAALCCVAAALLAAGVCQGSRQFLLLPCADIFAIAALAAALQGERQRARARLAARAKPLALAEGIAAAPEAGSAISRFAEP